MSKTNQNAEFGGNPVVNPRFALDELRRVDYLAAPNLVDFPGKTRIHFCLLKNYVRNHL